MSLLSIDVPAGVSLAEPTVLVGSWLGAGFVAPLRAGLAVASVWPVAVLASRRGRLTTAALAAVLAGVGIWAANAWEAQVAIKDDGRIVIDEVAGYLAGICVIGRAGWGTAGGFAAAFLLLDRLKPWPLSQVEAVPGGLGVVVDDVVAALVLGGVVWALTEIRRRARSDATARDRRP